MVIRRRVKGDVACPLRVCILEIESRKRCQLQFDFHLVSDGLTTDWTLDILFGPIVHLDFLEAR